MMPSSSYTSIARDHPLKLSTVQEGAPVADHLIGAQPLLGQVVVELPSAFGELQDGLVDGDQIGHDWNSTTAHLCLTRGAHVCNTNAMGRTQLQQGGIKATDGTGRTLDSTGTICSVPNERYRCADCRRRFDWLSGLASTRCPYCGGLARQRPRE